MEQWLEKLPIVHRAFLKIKEPRVTRLIHFVIYLTFAVVGVLVLTDPPGSFKDVLGSPLTLLFSGFVGTGGLLGAVAVLPGIWWLERAALFALGTAMVIYSILVFALHSSSIGLGVCFILILKFILRYREIKGSQLAPIVA